MSDGFDIQMDQILQEIKDFTNGFSDLMVSLHKSFLGLQMKDLKCEKEATLAIKNGFEALAKCDKIINYFIVNPTSDPELQQVFMQFMVSFKPQIYQEIQVIKEELLLPDEERDAHYEKAINDMFKDDVLDKAIEEEEKELNEKLGITHGKTKADENDQTKDNENSENKDEKHEEVEAEDRINDEEEEEESSESDSNAENRGEEEKKEEENKPLSDAPPEEAQENPSHDSDIKNTDETPEKLDETQEESQPPVSE